QRKAGDDWKKDAFLVKVSWLSDFFSAHNICVFCDGAVHDEPEQRARDAAVRRQLRGQGYRVIVIRYDQDLDEQIRQYPEVFGGAQR
ncbi:MAG: DUF559 domain-containing protein, partial [Nitrospinota bacterium]